MAVPRKGLRDIRTYSGLVDGVFVPHKAYLRISILEMEKVRRGRERLSAIQRVEDIDTRFEEIEAEKAELQEFLDSCEENNSNPDGGPETEPKTLSRRSKGGFKLKY